MTDAELARNPTEVGDLISTWAEKKIGVMSEDASISVIQTNVMFKQLLYDDDSINFGSNGTNWKKKTEIARELKMYKPWSVAHAKASVGGRRTLRRKMESIIETSGSSSEALVFEHWWTLSDSEDRPMLFPKVWGHTAGKLWLPVSDERAVPAFFSFGLVNVLSRTKLLIQCGPKASDSVMSFKRNLAASHGWLMLEFSDDQIRGKISKCFDSIAEYLRY